MTPARHQVTRPVASGGLPRVGLSEVKAAVLVGTIRPYRDWCLGLPAVFGAIAVRMQRPQR